jgi:homoserine kinase
MTRVRARCPASSANLGPGFDALAIALSLYVEVEVESAEELTVSISGEGSHLPPDHTNLAARVARDVRGDDNVSIAIRSDVPVGRGLGSSAAVATATAAACGSENPFAVAARFDGHCENAAASALGGLVAATMIDGEPVAERLPLDPQLAFVLLIPDRELATSEARAVLPPSVPFADAVANLGRMALLLAGLASRSRLHPEAGEDRLHQPARSQLFPEATSLLGRLRVAGATVGCWSGAGPSLLGICSNEAVAEKVRVAGEAALSEAGIPGKSLLLRADTIGLVIS